MKENRDPIKKTEKKEGQRVKMGKHRQIIKQICITKWWRRLSNPIRGHKRRWKI